MPLLPNTPFTEGDDWTPELAYMAFNSPVFDDQPGYLGHRSKLTDAELSDSAGQIKPRLEAIEDAFKVSVESGLTLRHQAGSVTMPNGGLESKPAGLVVAPDNTTSYVYISPGGNVRCATDPPTIRLLLAKVVAVSGSVSTIEDLRHPATRQLAPIASAVKSFGGSNRTDKVCTAGEVFDQGLYYYQDFTVPAGITITVDKWAKIYCSGNVTINGSVNVTVMASGAAPYSTWVGAGNVGGLPGSGAGGGSGSSAFGGSPYPYGAQSFGSGGGLGFANGSTGSAVNFGAGGRGGGGLWIEAAGTILVTGSIFAKGGSAFAGSISSGTARISGSGGGSGGLVLLSSLLSVTVTASAAIDVRGGNGGNGTNNMGSGNAGGGGGGGGGYVVLISPANNATGATILLNGGALGAEADLGGGGLGGGGGGGFGGSGGHQSAGSAGKLIVRPFVPIGG